MILINANGKKYTATSATINIAGNYYRGVKALSWKAERPKTYEYGVGPKPFGFTRGQCKASASLEIIKAQGDRLIWDLQKMARTQQGSASASCMDAEFNLGAKFKESDLGLSSAEILGASIVSAEDVHAAEGIVCKIESLVRQSISCVVNGEPIVDMPDLA